MLAKCEILGLAGWNRGPGRALIRDMTDQQPSPKSTADLDKELDRLQARLPERVARFVGKVRSPGAAPYRIPIGIALIGGGVVGFLPILGFWMIPLGLAVMAQDVPPLRPPLLWVLKKVNGSKNDAGKDER